MDDRGYVPLEFVSLLEFRDYDLVVRCIELVRGHISSFAPECQIWETEVIALCHHGPTNIYPALGVYDAGLADFDEIERFGRRAEAWVRVQPLGWLLDESAKFSSVSWRALCERGPPPSSTGNPGQPFAAVKGKGAFATERLAFLSPPQELDQLFVHVSFSEIGDRVEPGAGIKARRKLLRPPE